jgi:cation:H+ antiporter
MVALYGIFNIPLLSSTIPGLLIAIPFFIIGVLVLYKASDMLIDGTVKTALQIGVSTLIISVLLVGFGTSAPEFAISVGAAIQSQNAISLGTIIGSVIANILLVLGISAIIKPINVKKGIIGRELAIMICAAVVLAVSSFLGLLDDYRFIGGILFLSLFAIFIWFFINCAKNERVKLNNLENGRTWRHILFVVIGIAGVVIGAYILIESSVMMAHMFGVPSIVIAMSMVAIGTSLPELVVSSMASYKDESDVAIGNVLGSNVFNILLILGFAALFTPLKADEHIDTILILLAVCFLMLPIVYTKNKITRFEGVIMLFIYSGFILYIFRDFFF